MDPVGDSAGAGEASMQAGAVRGMARLGEVITARDTGADIMVGIMDIITIIIIIAQVIIHLIITAVHQLVATEVMSIQEVDLPVVTAAAEAIVPHQTDRLL